MGNAITLSVPGTQLVLVGDTHILVTLSRYTDPISGALVSSTPGHSELAAFASRINAAVVHIGDVLLSSEAAITSVEQFLDEVSGTSLIHCMGNWDYDANWWYNHTGGAEGVATQYISDSLKQSLTVFPYGHNNIEGTGVPWFSESINNVRVICVDSVQDMLYDGVNNAYPYVNPSGHGETNLDWSGISVAASPQREFIRSELDTAAANKQHVLVAGHRPVYGATDYDFRRNHTEALDETIEDGYPKGLVIELEDWCRSTGQHLIYLNGDHHAYCVSKPIYRGAVNNDYGIIHVNMTSGPTFRNVDLADPSIHLSYAGDGGISTIDNPILYDYPENQGASGGKIFFMLADWRSNKLIMKVYQACYPNAYVSPPRYLRGAYLLETFEVPMRGGKLTGGIRRGNSRDYIRY